MSEIKFSRNFKALSINSGPNTGFEFELYCERCGDAWLEECPECATKAG